MMLRYLYKMDPQDETAEIIMESDTLAPMVSCVEHFWDNLGVRIPYFRMIDFEKDGVVVDFGHHFRFYHVTGYSGTFQEFAKEWEAARKLIGGEIA